jgi:tRNA pseudouridine38-40 synthase
MRLHIAYDGTDYLGWQRQTIHDGPTVQGELEKALLSLTREKISTFGSGRTDAGVHADDQVVHFDLEGDPEKFNWMRGLNRFLPDSIRVQRAFKAPDDFHVVRNSVSKTYIYSVQDGTAPNPLSLKYSWWLSSTVDIDYLNSLSQCLIGKHDFKSFQTAGTDLAHTVREITDFRWIRTSDTTIEAHISGTGFLKQMVRNLVGCLTHQYWLKPLSEEHIIEILKALDRSRAHGTAPAHGLRLHRVKYPAELDKNCIKT